MKQKLLHFRPIVKYHLKENVKHGVGSEIHIGVVHTSPEGTIDDRSSEYRQVEEALNRANMGAARGERWILTGDFYLPPEAPINKPNRNG